MSDTATPARRPRSNAWTKPKMRKFLEVLAEASSVSDAARAVGMSRQSAYRLRAQLIGQPFDVAWEAALEIGLRQLAHIALERVINGVVEPVFYHGELVGERVRHSERLLMFMMANPQRVGRNHLARDHAAHSWLGLMDRIEQGPLDWDESPKPRGKKAQAKAEAALTEETRAFYEQSHYTELAPTTRLINAQGIDLPRNRR